MRLKSNSIQKYKGNKMAGLYKKEVLIRPTSDITVQGAKDFASNWMRDTFQDVDKNKDADGNYIDYFFADVFDARTGNIYRVFTEACKDKYSMDTIEFDVLDKVKINESIAEIDETVERANEQIEAMGNIVYQATAVVI